VGYAGSITTSGITAQAILDRVRYDLNEIIAPSGGTGYWKDPELIYYMDEAVREIVYQTRCLETGVSNIIVIADARTYTIADTISGVSWLDIEKVEYDIGLSGNTTDYPQIFDLDRVPFSNLRYGKEKEFALPKSYSVWNNTLYIFPIPRDDPASGVTMSGNTIYLYAITKPSGVTNSSSKIETPAFFDFAIRDYVKAKAYEKSPYTETRAPFYFEKFMKRIKEYQDKIMKRNVATAP